MSHVLSAPASRALAAAHQATEAATELLRYAREGEGLDGPFEIEVIEKLADALVMAIEIEPEDKIADDDDLGRLFFALKSFLEGWA